MLPLKRETGSIRRQAPLYCTVLLVLERRTYGTLLLHKYHHEGILSGHSSVCEHKGWLSNRFVHI